jgi:hypothetical protein
MSRQQDPRTARLLRLGLPIAPRRRSTRDLQIECLESRVVLSALPNVESPAPAAVQLVETSGTVELANSVPSIDTATTNVALAQNAAVTVAAADSTLTTSNLVPNTPASDVTVPTAPKLATGGPGGPSGSGQPLLPPIIIEFDAECQNGVWLFSGHVLDDKDVTGLTIHFGGVLAGQTATVNDEGSFELIITLDPGTSGFATAYTIDRDGLKSEIASVRVN